MFPVRPNINERAFPGLCSELSQRASVPDERLDDIHKARDVGYAERVNPESREKMADCAARLLYAHQTASGGGVKAGARFGTVP